MKIVFEYSHLGGAEIPAHRYPHLLNEIYDVIQSVKPQKTKVSREKTKEGQLLYSPSEINKQFKQLFEEKGVTEIREYFDIAIPGLPYVIRRSFKQIDFVKNDVFVEVQLGKYAFMFYDLAKFQYFFNENKLEVAVEIVPSHTLHKNMSSGVSYGEQLIFDIERLKRHFPAVPIQIILIDI